VHNYLDVIQKSCRLYCSIIFLLFSSNYAVSQDVQFKFSMDGIVNKDYLIPYGTTDKQDEWWYKREWTKSYLDSLKKTNRNRNDIIIQIPDSLAKKIFKVEKDDYVVNFQNSKLQFIDQIHHFYAKRVIGADTEIIAHFALKNHKNAAGFNVIVENVSQLDLISDQVNIDSLTIANHYNLESIIIDYFISNRKDIPTPNNYQDYIDVENKQKFRVECKKYFTFKYLCFDFNRNDVNEYLILGNHYSSNYSPFVAIILDSVNLSFLESNYAIFEQILKLNDCYYILLHQGISGSGANTYSLHKINDNEFITVWSDGSYAD